MFGSAYQDSMSSLSHLIGITVKTRAMERNSLLYERSSRVAKAGTAVFPIILANGEEWRANTMTTIITNQR